MNTYTTHKREGNKYIIAQVTERSFTLISLTGNAIVTHVGGNGRFKFTLNGIDYDTEFTKTVCTDLGLTYYDYSQVNFNINIREEWSKLYIHHTDKLNYWKQV